MFTVSGLQEVNIDTSSDKKERAELAKISLTHKQLALGT